MLPNDVVENHMLFGSPEPPDEPEDIRDKRYRLGEGCHFRIDGECHCDPDDWSDMCWGKENCPEGRW